jgi:ectoine hydroxylase-related dioxygenase (phytanoyl-CoA dioxygenase family)
VREQVYLITHDREALPPAERRVPGGASSLLIDHPKVIEVLEDLYGGPDSIRLEACGPMWRERGEREGAGPDGLSQGWHQGGPELATSPVFGFQYKNGRMYPGMMRVIFELGEVSQGDGGTHFIVGSHKANFSMSPAFLRRSEKAILDLSAKHSPLITGYDCPAGSAIFFTEALCQCAPQ